MGEEFISPEKIRSLEERMRDLGIPERDIEEKFIRAQGRGGQKVNKSSSCVYLKHLPTGIEVKCQKARTQAMNRFFARRALADKVEEKLQGRASPAAHKADKIRKQKHKRAKRARGRTETTTCP
ncbi:MAG: peptide chain release factor-like protein [Deltaproteobacteria bacterium]|nr:peptide chain release factor-like protein [Deltaproteobacteria bacterium]